MKKIILVIILLALTHVSTAAELTIDEIIKNMESAIASIENVKFNTSIRTRTKEAAVDDTRVLTEGTVWFKKPYFARQEFSFGWAPDKK
ncbi:MAG: hypothetical protein KC713_10140, partial [Candidatus Omnitrophica bacterium]|nr:hypothetical protein [Candidatus Omnitrophota bacterium]